MTRTAIILSLTGAAAMALVACGKSSKESTETSSTEVAAGTAPRNLPTKEPHARGPRPSLSPSRGPSHPATDRPPHSRDADHQPPSRDRLRVDRRERFKKFDSDRDGVLSEDERRAIRAERDAKRAQRDAKRGQHSSKRAERVTRLVKAADGNGDGTLTRDEFESAGNRRLGMMLGEFDAIDTDGDGSLSAEELSEMMSRRGRSGRRGKGAPPAASGADHTP